MQNRANEVIYKVPFGFYTKLEDDEKLLEKASFILDKENIGLKE